jgi:hypothetical protein
VVTAYRAVALTARQEWVCGHRHRTKMAAFDCGLKKVRRWINGLLSDVPRRHFAQWTVFIRDADTGEDASSTDRGL